MIFYNCPQIYLIVTEYFTKLLFVQYSKFDYMTHILVTGDLFKMSQGESTHALEYTGNNLQLHMQPTVLFCLN